MNKYDQAQYLVNLLAIMDSRETAGQQRGQTIGKEYMKVYDDFIGTIRKEHADETRNGAKLDGSDESRAQKSVNQPSLGRGYRDGSSGGVEARLNDEGTGSERPGS